MARRPGYRPLVGPRRRLAQTPDCIWPRQSTEPELVSQRCPGVNNQNSDDAVFDTQPRAKNQATDGSGTQRPEPSAFVPFGTVPAWGRYRPYLVIGAIQISSRVTSNQTSS